MKALDMRNLDEIQHLIFNFEYGPEDKIEIDKNNKKIWLAESTEFNTESSTKLDNKLEISINKESASSTRNLNIVSPINKGSVKVSTESPLKMLHADNLQFLKVKNRIKLPYVNIAVDITMSELEIKKLFLAEMRR